MKSECNLIGWNNLNYYLEIFNAEVLFREDASADDFIDVVVGNRIYLPCVYVSTCLKLNVKNLNNHK